MEFMDPEIDETLLVALLGNDTLAIEAATEGGNGD